MTITKPHLPTPGNSSLRRETSNAHSVTKPLATNVAKDDISGVFFDRTETQSDDMGAAIAGAGLGAIAGFSGGIGTGLGAVASGAIAFGALGATGAFIAATFLEFSENPNYEKTLLLGAGLGAITGAAISTATASVTAGTLMAVAGAVGVGLGTLLGDNGQ